MSMSGDSPVTVTVSETVDGFICMLIAAVCPTSNCTPVVSTVVKPVEFSGDSVTTDARRNQILPESVGDRGKSIARRLV